jgi:hypothetical protein
VVNVTVGQSTNLVVNPASLSIPANGAAPFTVKLAKDPTPSVTVTVTTSTPDLTTTPASLTFTSANFSNNQTVLVSAGLGAAPGAQSVLLDAGPLGQFNLPVTITPTSKTTFFIDPTPGGVGNDAFPGTAAQPWQTVANALDITQASGSKVAAVANAGNNVVVTILGGANVEAAPAAGINTPVLVAGSVTVLQAPFPKTFDLNLGPAAQLILNKGYKLQDINIISAFAGAGPAILIKHPTAGLASVDVKCTAVAAGQGCVQVAGAGSHILKDVRVDVKDVNAGSFGILNNDANANLSIIGGRVRPTDNNNPITLIDSTGVLTVTGLLVDMTNKGHAQKSTGIVLRAPTSSVTGSTINVNDSVAPNPIGIEVQAAASKSTVEGNTFIGFGNMSAVGVKGGGNLSSDALLNNTFSGIFAAKVLP